MDLSGLVADAKEAGRVTGVRDAYEVASRVFHETKDPMAFRIASEIFSLMASNQPKK